MTVDALAVARIWSFLLHKDGIAHHIVPCAGPAQLETAIWQHGDAAISAAVIVLGCGAHLNLMHYWASFQYVHHPQHEQQQDNMKDDDDLDPEDDDDDGGRCSCCKLYVMDPH